MSFVKSVSSLLALLATVVILIVASTLTLPVNAVFDEDFARTGLYYAKISQCAADQITHWNCRFCPYYPHFVDRMHAQSSVSEVQYMAGFDTELDMIVVTVRATYTPLNWVVEYGFNSLIPYFHAEDCPLCFAFAGMYTEYMINLRHYLFDAVTKLKNKRPGKKILFTGYSSGGDMLLFATLDLQRDGIIKKGEYKLLNFGESRCGNSAFSRYAIPKIDQHHDRWRLTHDNDMIPRLPPHIWIGSDAKHAGHEVFYMNGTQWKECNDYTYETQEDPSCGRGNKGYVSFADFAAHVVYMNTVTSCHPNYTMKPDS